MNAIVVSDLHIGSPFFLQNGFEQFLRKVPKECELILNGDVLDEELTIDADQYIPTDSTAQADKRGCVITHFAPGKFSSCFSKPSIRSIIAFSC